MRMCERLNMSPRELEESECQDVYDWMVVMKYEAEMQPKGKP
jgi:hypothetical protein